MDDLFLGLTAHSFAFGRYACRAGCEQAVRTVLDDGDGVYAENKR